MPEAALEWRFAERYEISRAAGRLSRSERQKLSYVSNFLEFWGVVRPQRLTLGPLIGGPPSVHFLNDCASARIDQHHSVTGIDIAIFGQARTPIRGHGHKFHVARHPGANDDLFPALNRADFVLSNVSLDLRS